MLSCVAHRPLSLTDAVPQTATGKHKPLTH